MRKFVALMAAAVMLFAFCASANAATQVTIWHTFTDAQQAALEKFAADFNASQSDYEVVVESQAYSGFLDTVYNAVANGVGPNMIINYASTAADYVKDGLVVDLSKYVFDEEIGMADVYNSLPESIKAETVGKFLPVYDNLERALAQETADEAYKKGVEMTMNQLVKVMEGLGVTSFGEIGEAFDPARHNAVMHVEEEGLGENVIAEVFQKGFLVGEKVIRFAMVKVAN